MKISKAILGHIIAAPLVALVTVGAAWLAKHFPGLPALNNEQVGAAGLAVGTAAAGFALHYLKGLREWQLLEAQGIIDTSEPTEGADMLDPRFRGHPVADPRQGPPNQGDAGLAFVPTDPSAPSAAAGTFGPGTVA